MGKGKIAAQCAHASMKVLTDLGKFTTVEDSNGTIKHRIFGMKAPEVMYEWLNNNYAKIVVSVDSEEKLLDLFRVAKTANILCSLVTDNGLTEFHGVPTNTCVAIGPALSEDIDKLTGHLPLL